MVWAEDVKWAEDEVGNAVFPHRASSKTRYAHAYVSYVQANVYIKCRAH